VEDGFTERGLPAAIARAVISGIPDRGVIGASLSVGPWNWRFSTAILTEKKDLSGVIVTKVV
jgi:hypothetical protein